MSKITGAPRPGPYIPYSGQPLDRIAAKLDTLVTAIERLTSEIVGLRLELQAARERWENGATIERTA